MAQFSVSIEDLSLKQDNRLNYTFDVVQFLS